jgi:murein DD-endopeptidase MepM/ murein hydrolase activator NlpD
MIMTHTLAIARNWIPAFAGMTMKICVLFSAFFLLSCTFMRPPRADLPSYSSIKPGETIAVKGNENIYLIAHSHNVSMREIIVLNNLKPPFEVRRGQKLILPAGGSSFTGDLAPPESSPLHPVDRTELAPITPPEVTSQSLEPISSPLSTTNLKLGIQSAPVEDLNRPAPAPKQATTTMTPPQFDTAAIAVSSAMRWPVQGPILSSFGSKGAGLNNDGINIGAPKGAPVVASAAGTVAYAGNDMKGFGNLVLIRHNDDLITAYAHLDRVLVKKDSVVSQGSMIGTVGKTGNVSSPQLHFEIRQDGKPVDPSRVIKSAL